MKFKKICSIAVLCALFSTQSLVSAQVLFDTAEDQSTGIEYKVYRKDGKVVAPDGTVIC